LLIEGFAHTAATPVNIVSMIYKQAHAHFLNNLGRLYIIKVVKQ
jgi:hypothetical protein